MAMPFVVWLLLLVLPFILGIDNNTPNEERSRFIGNVVSSYCLLLCLFYIHTFAVYPLWDKNILLYVVALLALLIGYWLCWHLLRFEPPHIGRFVHHPSALDSLANGQPEPRLHHERHWRRSFRNPYNLSPILSSLVAILCSFCYRVILDNRARQQLVKERENINLQSELTFLRSQISPHFMFNILNNLVSLARKKSDDLEPSLINLSQLMRYMLYESDDNKVLLSKELEYLNSYINLQLLRFGSKVKVNLQTSGDLDRYTIEPMLLIPFVENAVKHGTGMIENPVINISIAVVETQNQLHFKVDNVISPLDVSKDSNSGIGIVNVRRRLAILYPNKHQLDIENQKDTFTVNLFITLAQ